MFIIPMSSSVTEAVSKRNTIPILGQFNSNQDATVHNIPIRGYQTTAVSPTANHVAVAKIPIRGYTIRQTNCIKNDQTTILVANLALTISVQAEGGEQCQT